MDPIDIKALVFGAELGASVPQMDLHAYRDDFAAIRDLELFVFQQWSAHTPIVRIIHGRGNGLLRERVHTLLSTLPCIELFEDSHQPNEIGGVTYAVLKQEG